MRFEHVCLEAIACTLPEEVVSSAEIEQRLAPLYQRLRLPEGRLELMTGIVERRFWSPGTMPGEISAQTAEKALRQAGIERGRVGALIHGSVCRDYLEPATACGVHRRLGLPGQCMIYDVSNACLGLLNGMVQVANMIELGQIEAGIVVGTESSRTLVENTIHRLNRDLALTREDVKTALASLTLGSGSAAVVLAHRGLSRTGTRLVGGVVQANTAFCDLCHSDRDETIGGESRPLMWTDSESLLREGVCTAKTAFARFLDTLGWQRHQIARTFCHQVGRAHQRALFAALDLDASLDYPTVHFLGNTGSVALPMTAALGLENGCVRSGDRVALLGIGSGINVVMLGVEWGCVSQGIR
ncbi:MAG: 3-oxoacyl-ACP synthase III [Thermoguttaceae bacterium]|jgi:3-oxoacyl-[acyl-carrier-protein] synthase-3|nr:3-oxoacyl-ACP synthase III [Thermoguttaceae bacterium]